MFQSCRNFLEFGISRRTLGDIHDEIRRCQKGAIEVEVSLGDESSFSCVMRQNRPTIQYTPNTSEQRFASVVRALSEFESEVAHMRTEYADYTVQRYQEPHGNHRSRAFADGRRVFEAKTKLFSVDDLLNNTRMKCAHETAVSDERVIQALVPQGESEQYHRQSFCYYEADDEHPLAQFDCTTKRTSTSTKYNIELELHMAQVLRTCSDYESVCGLFDRLARIVEPYMQSSTDRPLMCGHGSYQVPNRQLPITMQKQHVRVLRNYAYAATPKFDGTRQYVIFDAKGILDATTREPMEVRPICRGRLSDDLQSGDAAAHNRTSSIIVLDTEYMSDGTYHVFDVIRDTTRNTHQKPLNERMQFVVFICREYQTAIRDKDPGAPAIIPKQMIFDSLSCAIGVIHHQYMNATYKIDGVIFVPIRCSYEDSCDRNRPDPVLKFKPLRLLTIDFGVDLRELDALPEAEKHKTTVYLSAGKSGHADLQCVLRKYQLNWVDMYALLRTAGADGLPFGGTGLCIVECRLRQQRDGVTHIDPLRIRSDKQYANSRQVVQSNLQSIRELTEAESEIARSSGGGDAVDMDDLSVIQFWLEGPRYERPQVGHGEVMQLDAALFASVDASYANKRVLFVSPRNVFENLPRNHASRMMLLQDDGCRNVQGVVQIRSELVLTEHEHSLHAIYVVCLPNATTAQWVATKRLSERLQRTLTKWGVCVLVMSKDDRFDSYAPISAVLTDAQLQCDSTTSFANWTMYVYKRKPSSTHHHGQHPRSSASRSGAATAGASLSDEQRQFDEDARGILDSLEPV